MYFRSWHLEELQIQFLWSVRLKLSQERKRKTYQRRILQLVKQIGKSYITHLRQSPVQTATHSTLIKRIESSEQIVWTPKTLKGSRGLAQVAPETLLESLTQSNRSSAKIWSSSSWIQVSHERQLTQIQSTSLMWRTKGRLMLKRQTMIWNLSRISSRKSVKIEII